VIVELRVRDLATIADVTLPLGPGLNVLTGETGAGKSMLVDALALLLGARADPGQVRPGAARIVVEGVFEPVGKAVQALLDQQGLEAEDDRIIIRREVAAEGRSRAWVNGSPATASVLAQLGRLLVDLHGQHETRTLLEPERQREVLDAFGDAAAEARAVAAAWDAARRLTEEANALIARRDEVKRRADYLRHLVQEIDAARLRVGEDESLDLEARRLSQAGTLSELAGRIAELVEGEEGSALGALARADKALTSLERTDPEVGSWRELLDGAFAQLEELARAAGEYTRGLADDPGRLAELERRRDLLYRLKQKYGETLPAVLETRRQAGAELDLLDTADIDLNAIAERRARADAELVRLAGGLSGRRRTAAESLARAVNRLLPGLGLPSGRLSVELVPESAIGAGGAESVRFLARLNPGMEPRPVAASASGGEQSRLMLAIKTALGRHDEVATLVFDEIDAGIGGEVGSQVAATLGRVAARHQVLVITHLPQIAARAARHLTVAKRTRAGLATSDVAVIHGEDRVAELARMLGDQDAETARRHALALLNH
jgi:DNA repair protein RecN (Recombination protein N)